MSLNVELLLAVKEQILREPEAFDMSEWARSDDKCGTVCCIAGWAVALSGQDPLENADIEGTASELLGMRWDIDPYILFFSPDWPDNFRLRFKVASTPAERSIVTAEYIDYFIAKHSEVPA